MQQPQSPESYAGIARRPLDVEDYLDIVRRHKGWIAGPVFAALVVSVVGAFLWPDSYVSVATIRVLPSQVPENLVQTNINSHMSQRVNAMYQTISSRTTLTNIINQYNLYPRERQRRPTDDIVEEMQQDIHISGVGSVTKGPKETVSAFQIAFEYDDRFIAQKVTAELVSRFINENTRERTTQSIQTTAFLREQLEKAKKDLDAVESKLAAFRQTFQGRLPEQVLQNTSQLAALENRISNLNARIGQVGQEKMLFEADLRTAKNQRAALVPVPERVAAAQRQKAVDTSGVDRDILRLEAGRSTMLEQKTASHPDIRKIDAQLASLRTVREKMLADAEKPEEASPASAPAGPPRMDAVTEKEARMLDGTIERIESTIRAKEAEADGYRKEIASTERQIRAIQSRIEAAPASEQQYGEIMRDREAARLRYEDLNKKQAQSSIAEALERQQQGETLELLDPASLPQTPTKPKRALIIGAGLVLGVIIGLTLAGAREAKDTSLKNLKDVRAYTKLTILGSVPLLENDLVVRRRRRLTWLAWSTACLVGILVMTGAVFYYFSTKA